MHKKKIAVMTMAIIISNYSSTTLEVLGISFIGNTEPLSIQTAYFSFNFSHI